MTEANWNRLRMITAQFTSERMSGSHLLEGQYTSLLNYLEDDMRVGDKCMLGMRRAPGSQSRHHSVEGGLVAHLLQMWDVWLTLPPTIRIPGNTHPHLNDSTVWRGILHHDLNKVWKYALATEDPWKVDYAKKEDPMTAILGDMNKSFHFINLFGIHLTIPLHAALITSEGGFSAYHPETDTVLGKMLYLLDELSANVVDRMLTDRFWDSKVGGIDEVP